MHTRTLRLPDELYRQLEVVARAEERSVNALIVDALTMYLHRRRVLEATAAVMERDKELLARLAN